MSVYEHKKIRPWAVMSWLLRSVAGLLSLWPLLLVIALFVSPITLHMRWEYTYRDFGNYRVYYDCTYLGPAGFVNYMHGDNCPFFTLIDPKKERRFPG